MRGFTVFLSWASFQVYGKSHLGVELFGSDFTPSPFRKDRFEVIYDMANEQNLISLADRTTSEKREIAKKGGKASGEARRKRRTLKEELLLMLEDPEIQKKLTAAMIEKGLDGDIRAFEVIRDTIGEKPKDILDINSNDIRITIGEND